MSYQNAARGIPQEVNSILVGSRGHEGLAFVGTHGVVLEELEHQVFDCLIELLPLGTGIVRNRLLQRGPRELLTSVSIGIEPWRHF